MKAGTIIPKKAGSFSIRDVEIPQVHENEVLVKVLMLGLDGTDKEIGEGLYGEAPKGCDYLIEGHESLGEVVQIGSAVKGMSVGDIVVATVRRPDDCINCKAGESDMCIKGDYTERGIKGMHGYMTEYYAEIPEYLVKIPVAIKNSAVMLEPMSIAEKAVKQIFEVQKRMVWEPKTAVVLGTGTVGLFAAMILRLRGLKVISVDRTSENPVKDKIYGAFGITHINSAEIPISDIQSKVRLPIDIAVELTGNPAVIKEALGLTRLNGIVCLLSVTGGSYEESFDMAKFNYGMVLGNKVIIGSVNSNIKHFMQGAEDMQTIEKLHPKLLESMITERVPLESFKSYDILSSKKNIKVVITIAESTATKPNDA